MYTIIQHASIVNERSVRIGCVVLKGKYIEALIYNNPTKEELVKKYGPSSAYIDASGQYLIPGIVDDQVHFREPGQPEKGTMETESRAALLGGVTSVFDMPNNVPAATTVLALEEKYKRAAKSMYTHYAFYMGATNTNEKEVLSKDLPGCGLKIFMGSSTGNMLVDDPEVLNIYFKEFKGLIATHCEDETAIRENLKAARAKYNEDIPWIEHGTIRSRKACISSTTDAIEMALRHRTKLHILHVSTKEEIGLITSARRVFDGISCEAALPHIWFSEEDYREHGSHIKCNPALKTPSDRDAILQGIENRWIQVIGSDHAPHTLAEKQNKYEKAPSGIPLIQHTCNMLMELVAQGRLSITHLAEACSHEPARLFGLRNRGFIREGYYADLVLVDPGKRHLVTKQSLETGCQWSPLEGFDFSSSVTHVFVNGTLAVKDNNIIEKPSVTALL